MLKKILKWIGIVLAVLVVLIIVAVVGLYIRANARLTQKYNIQVEQVAIPTDAASIARGKHLATFLCTGCHGEDLAGTAFFNNSAIGIINADNLTGGKGGIGASFTDTDFVRTLRHGVSPDGTSVLIMPATDYRYLSDQDLGALIAYLKTIPPVDKEWQSANLTVLGHVLVGVGAFDSSIIAEQIDQTGPRLIASAVGVTKEYGDYLVRIDGCRSCHGLQLSGGKDPDPSITLLGPNLTPGGELAKWSDADFIKTMRTGVTPSGDQLEDAMPWKDIAKMSDDELKAVFLYLQALPKLTTTTQ